MHSEKNKSVEKFTYLGSNISSTESDVNTRIGKAWLATNRLSVIWKSDLPDKLKRRFFQAVVVSVLLYGCTTWTLTKRIENKLDGSCTRMLRAVLNKSWKQHPTKKQLYGPPPHFTNHTSKTDKTRGTLLEKQGRTHKRRPPVEVSTWARKCGPTGEDVH